MKNRSIGKILRPFRRKNDLEFQRQRYKRRKKSGLCVKCGKRSAQDTNLRCVWGVSKRTKIEKPERENEN